MISVLCVDDDSTYLSLEKRCLEEPGALTVTTAFSAPEALRAMETSRFDAVVADYQMPGMDGIELLKAVRAANPGLPFILFTGKGREEVVIEAFNDGVDFYLQKNGDPKVLFASLKDTIKKAVKLGAVWKAFHDSETRYRRLFETAQNGILILDAKSGKITDANPFLLTLLGYTREEMLGKKLWEIGYIRDKVLAEQAAAVLKRTGYIRYEDLPLATKDGRAIDVEFVSNVYVVDNEKVIQCNIRDITDRRRAEEAVIESEERFRTILHSMQTGVIVIDANSHTILDANQKSLDMIGGTRETVLGSVCHSFICPAEPGRCPITDLGQTVDSSECILFNAQKEKVPILKSVTATTLGGKKVLIESIIDITEHKRAEVALRESELRYRSLFENMQEGFAFCRMLYDEEKRPTDFIYLNVNPAFDRITDTTTVVGKPVTEVSPGIKEAFPKLFEIYGRVAWTGEPESFDLDFRPSEKWLHISVYSPAKEHFVAFFEDITERKAAAEAMKTFSEDLDRKVLERTSNLDDVNLSLMTEIDIRFNAEKQLSKNLNEKDVLLREVHHRVKNNLQIIISLLNLQSRYITDDTTLFAFRESQNRVRAMALVHEKLYQSTDLATIDLDNYLRFLGDNLFQFMGMRGKGITLTMDIRDISLAIDTAIPVGLIINELISNSLKYAFPEGRKGEISFTIHRQEHTLTILFKDNGVGIPEDFDWRDAMSLGLRLVCSLVDQLDGTIELDRTAGTAFTIVVKEKE
ncbi:MAG: PAS domain S-box protein [Methanoregula sp.]|nr:PAS domain S-box protein [Methanoregula sp.]